ncbi:MAG: hypothetical protein HGA45_44330, partial [Chloroflexales bacterium]|nr:hypothetical protein [Chloroflexales bacterium]
MRELRLDFGDQKTAALIALGRTPALPLGDFLARFPAHAAAPIPPAWLTLPLSAFRVIPVSLGDDRPETADSRAASRLASPVSGLPSPDTFPAALTDSEAVARAYADEVARIGRYLSNDLAVLVVCDKALAEHICRHAVGQSNKRPVFDGESAGGDGEPALLQRELLGPGARIAALGRLLAGLKRDQVLVLLHLDTLAGGDEGALSGEARRMTEVLYRGQEQAATLLGFVDPSLGLPRVLADRFAVRVELAGLSREVIPHLLTRAERE